MNNLKYYKIPKQKIPCIYAIINAYDMKIYIGSTKNVSMRAKQHLTDLKAGKHVNKDLQRDFNKALRFAILYEVPECDMKHIKILEKLYMLQALEKGFELYNKLGVGDREKIINDIVNDFKISFETNENFEKAFRKVFNVNSWHLRKIIYRKERLL